MCVALRPGSVLGLLHVFVGVCVCVCVCVFRVRFGVVCVCVCVFRVRFGVFIIQTGLKGGIHGESR